jgi:hypothetical protein
MSEDNTIEYTIEENDTEMKPDNPNIRHSINGLSGIPPDVLNKLPPSFFGSNREMKPDKETFEDKPNLRHSVNGLSGIPQDVLNKLPPSFFGNEEIEHGDALREFMIKHKASMQHSSNDGINMHPNEYFKKVVMKEKND